ncbi:MAG: ATP-binding protein [Burkholderiaceae bacterium]
MKEESLYRFPARMESLVAMLELLRPHAAVVGEEPLLRAETAIEELLTNTVVHGEATRNPQASVWLSVHLVDGACALQYQDKQLQFDPRARIAEAMRRTANPMDQRPLGGLGLLMVFRLADSFRYQREDGRNCIDLQFRSRLADATA